MGYNCEAAINLKVGKGLLFYGKGLLFYDSLKIEC